MHNIWKIYDDCKAQLDTIHMDYSRKIISVSINNRLTRSCARTIYNRKDGTYKIEIAGRTAADNVKLDFIKDSMMHELLHTCPGCMNHGANTWKYRASIVNRKLGYNVRASATIEECEDAGFSPKNMERDARYRIVCEKCGEVVTYRYNACSLTEHPEKWKCGICKGKLSVIDRTKIFEYVAKKSKEEK